MTCSTRCAAICAIRRPAQEGQKPRFLPLKARSIWCGQVSQPRRTKALQQRRGARGIGGAYHQIVLVTTDQRLNGSWIVRHDEERPEIEQDYEQMKSGGWQLKKLSSTRYSEIVFYVLTVVLSYSLYHWFSNTPAGSRFADKTRQALALAQLRTRRTHVLAYVGAILRSSRP